MNENCGDPAWDMKVSHDETIQFLQKYMYFLPAPWMGFSYYLLFLVCHRQATQQLKIFN